MDETHPEAGWGDWLDEHAARFVLFARQQTRCEPDAHDLVQDAVLEAIKRWNKDSPPAAALVFAIIYRRAIDLARREKRRAGREAAAGSTAAELWFDTTVEEREKAQVVQCALAKLPKNFREVVTLKLWGGLTFAEIAEALDIPANTAASRYRYALEELKKTLICSYERV